MRGRKRRWKEREENKMRKKQNGRKAKKKENERKKAQGKTLKNGICR